MPQLTICSPSLQVADTVDKNLFLHEAHIHALANKKEAAGRSGTGGKRMSAAEYRQSNMAAGSLWG